MIIQGKDGSVNLYWNDIFLSSFPLGKYDLDFYKGQAEDLILDAMKQGKKMSSMIPICQGFCEGFYQRRNILKKKTGGEDHQFFCICLFVLIRLQIVDADDHLLIMGRKKKSKRIINGKS